MRFHLRAFFLLLLLVYSFLISCWFSVQFPIDVSLPWTLGRMILNDRDGEGLEGILDVFQIYNDAGYRALFQLKRQFFFEEVEAEVWFFDSIFRFYPLFFLKLAPFMWMSSLFICRKEIIILIFLIICLHIVSLVVQHCLAAIYFPSYTTSIFLCEDARIKVCMGFPRSLA